jgi:hypothetical protein
MQQVVGIDPGEKGAIAILCVADGGVRVESIYDMPSKISALAEIIKGISANSHVCIESPYTNTKGDADKELAKLIRKLPLLANYNRIIGMCAVCGIPIQSVAPRTWQATFAVSGKRNGYTSIAQCLKVFPECSDILISEGHRYDGRSDALLIAKWKYLQLSALNTSLTSHLSIK